MSNGYGKRGSGKNPDVAAAVRGGIERDFMDRLEKFAGNFQASNSQVRNIFTAVKKIEAKGFDKEVFLMLRPRLAYAAQRERNLRPLKDVLAPAVDEVLKAGDPDELKHRFHRFCLCCEAIVAYAKK